MTSRRSARPAGRVLVWAAIVGVVAGAALTGLAADANGPASASNDAVTRAAQLVALPYGPDTCKQGFVWRVAAPDDLVCVRPATRTATAEENALADSRREPGGGAWGPDTCKSGFVWREAFPADLVCVPPDRRDQAKADNAKATARRAVDPASLPEAQRPGTHTVVLTPASLLGRSRTTTYEPECRTQPNPNPPAGLPVGWGQVETDGDPCLAEVDEIAVRFDQAPLDQVPVKTIDRAVLTFAETPAQYCIYPPGTGGTCWRSGSGAPEFKPNGCVAALGFPTVDWVAAPPPGLVPQTAVQAMRISPREWDVSVPYRWQYGRTAPLGAVPPPPFGFLLWGGVDLGRLTAEDNTNCVSVVSDLRLRVTYTVPEDNGGEFIPPR